MYIFNVHIIEQGRQNLFDTGSRVAPWSFGCGAMPSCLCTGDDAVSGCRLVWAGSGRLTNRSCERVTFFLAGESPRKSHWGEPKFQKWLPNSKIWVKARFIVIDCYFYLLIVDWPPILRGADGGDVFHLNLAPHVQQVILRLFPNGVSVASQGTLLDRIFSATRWRNLDVFFSPVILVDVFFWTNGWDRGNLGSLCFVCFLWGDDDVCPAFLSCDNCGCLDGFNYLWYMWIVSIEKTYWQFSDDQT